jgi:O-antigen ligase
MKETNKNGIHLFGLGLLLVSVGFSGQLLDFTLVPRFLALTVCLLLSLMLIYKKQKTHKVDVDKLWLIYFSYTFFLCASILWSNTRSESYFESSKQILFFLSFLFTVYFLKKDAELFYKTLTRVSLLLFFIACGVGVYQALQLKSFAKEALYAITGLNGHKNLFSSFLFLNLFLLIRALLLNKGVLKLLYLFCVLVTLIILYFLKTKAVWLGLSFTFVFMALLAAYRLNLKEKVIKSRVNVFVIGTIILVNIFVLLFFKPLIHRSIHYTSQLPNETRVASDALKLEEERLILWDKTLEIFAKHPVLGVGAGNWQTEFPDAGLSGLWRAEDLNYTFQRPHNDLLWMLSESGLIGCNLFLVFILFLVFHLLRLIRLVKKNYSLSMELILCISFILGYSLVSFFDFPKERIEHSLWLNVIFGISYYQLQSHKQLEVLSSLKINKTGILVGMLILSASLYLGVLRFKGEFYTRRMYDFKNNDQKYELIKAASKAFSFAYTIDPTSVPLHWYTGNANAALGMYDKAKSDFLLAVRFAPFNRNVLNDLASSYAMNKNTNLAKKYYEEAARISPRFDEPKLNLAALYIQENNFKEAQFWLNSLLHDSERRTEYQTFINSQH